MLSYSNRFILIEGEEHWSNSQFESLQEPVNMVVDGILIIDEDVAADTLSAKLETLDIFGEVQAATAETKGALQGKVRANAGRISLKQEKQEESKPQESNNIGELSL